MSALLNQQVFKREVMIQKLKEEERSRKKTDIQAAKEKKNQNKIICDNIQKWIDQLDVEGYIS